MQQLWFILVALALVVTAWMARYEISAAGAQANRPLVYVLDRWTGNIDVCAPNGCVDVLPNGVNNAE